MENIEPQMDGSEWSLVVPPLPREEAERKYALWLEEQRRLGIQVAECDIRVDSVFAGPSKGCLVRVLWRRSAPSRR